MFIKSLTISTKDSVIREMTFNKGINFIVDETPSSQSKNDGLYTGNNVGKTTVLKLIDFCLGGDAKNIYSDTETKKDSYALVKDFLQDEQVLITLILKSDLSDKNSSEIEIERNFLNRNKKIAKINGENITDDKKFELRLLELIFPNQKVGKPSFRQIISHNIRYKDKSINNTLNTLDSYTADTEYETLYLFLLGCPFDEGEEKQRIHVKIRREESYKARLEKEETKIGYEIALNLIKSEIEALEDRKLTLKINECFMEDLESLNNVKYTISKVSSTISSLELRKSIILEAEEDLKSNKSSIDIEQIKMLYEQAKVQLPNIQKTFEDLVAYHNSMIEEKVRFITKELPTLTNSIVFENEKLTELLKREQEVSKKLAVSDSYADLEVLISELTQKYEKKGEYEKIVAQIQEAEDDLAHFNEDLDKIDQYIFSKEFEAKLKVQLNKLNQYFSAVSNTLYGEKYAVKYNIGVNKHNKQVYKFSAFNTNLSSGKKQGEIMCFDIAYILFADSEAMPCLHFSLNDKKELVHDNQLLGVSNYLLDKNVQFVASILKDKLPEELQDERYYIVKLSQNSKLFGIE